MAVTATFAETARERVGKQTQIQGVLTLSGTATAGGLPVTAATFNLGRLNDLRIHGTVISATGGTTGVGATYDVTASTVVFHEAAGTNAVFRESQSSLTGYLVRVTAIGQG